MRAERRDVQRASIFIAYVILGFLPLAPCASAQDAASAGVVGEVMLPGGIRAALTALDDPLPPDRSRFLLDVIRRMYGRPDGPSKDAGVQRLLAHLERAGRDANAARDMLPLPLAQEIWTKAVFQNAVSSPDLVLAILRSRDAARFYSALLSLDDATRAWLSSQPRLLAELSSGRSAAFLLAAPGLRVDGNIVRLPGGDAAAPAWEALVGKRTNDPTAFVHALVGADGGRTAYIVGATSELTPPQARYLLGNDAKRIAAVFRRAEGEWDIDGWTWWRPSVDPASLVAELPVDAGGRPVVPGSEGFWRSVLRAGDDGSAESAPVDIAWLCEEIFTANPVERRAIYDAVLFASRRITALSSSNRQDAVETVRGAIRFPALTLTLERPGLDDLHVFAGAARRAGRLSAIKNTRAAVRALSEFQGTLAMVIQATLHGGVPQGAFASLVTSLSAVDVNDDGEYEGRLVRWTKANLSPDLVPVLAGGSPTPEVEWEGARYRLDFAAAETARLDRLFDDAQFPALATARTLVDTADDLRSGVLTRERIEEHVSTLDRVAAALPSEEHARARSAARSLQRIARGKTFTDAAGLAPPLLAVADETFARGMRHAVYAAVFRQPDTDPALVADLAGRHLFGPGAEPVSSAWELPAGVGGSLVGWRATGSLLGLDTAVAEFSLVRLSASPPSRAPTLEGADRRVLIHTVALIDARALDDGDGERIVAAIHRGRARITSLRTEADVAALASDLRMGPARLTLLRWTVAHDPERATASFAPVEWLWAGEAAAAGFHAWGASAWPRLGCACVRMPAPRPLESFGGRWNTGVLASGFPDLNVRLAEFLAELHMPAALLAPILPAATADLVDLAVSRDRDDRRGLEEYVIALTRERVEEYLASLTAGGPLVPVSK